ncbi:hypothetical protein C6P44_003844 [Monosporozyma unispora]|nr:hypothetical protein C6P44_003844 [Kazachstania unispora]
MKTTNAILLAAVAATANAYTISADQSKQLDIIMKDVMSNLSSYMALISDPSSGITADNLPAGLMDVGAGMATDPNYKPDYSEVDIDAVSTFITKLSWFSTKLEPELEAAGVPMVKTSTPAAQTTAKPKDSTSVTQDAAQTTAKPKDSTSVTQDAAQTTAKPKDSTSVTQDAAQTTAKPEGSNSVTKDAAQNTGVETKYITSTHRYSNTTTITSCPPESSTVEITAKRTSEVTETVCDEVFQTVCDEVCHSKKSAAAKKTSQSVAPSSVAQVTKSATSSKPAIQQQTENGAAQFFGSIGAGVLAAAALLI